MPDKDFKALALEIAYEVAKKELGAHQTGGVFVKGEDEHQRKQFAEKLMRRTNELFRILISGG